jgi:hypothetical protein
MHSVIPTSSWTRISRQESQSKWKRITKGAFDSGPADRGASSTATSFIAYAVALLSLYACISIRIKFDTEPIPCGVSMPKPTTKLYAVRVGREPGIYST